MKEPEEQRPDSSKTGRRTRHQAGRQEDESGEFSVAMSRLESAVQEIVTVTTGQLTERATSLLDDTSKRLESELRLRRVTDDPEVEKDQVRRRRRSRGCHADAGLSFISAVYETLRGLSHLVPSLRSFGEPGFGWL